MRTDGDPDSDEVFLTELEMRLLNDLTTDYVEDSVDYQDDLKRLDGKEITIMIEDKIQFRAKIKKDNHVPTKEETSRMFFYDSLPREYTKDELLVLWDYYKFLSKRGYLKEEE